MLIRITRNNIGLNKIEICFAFIETNKSGGRQSKAGTASRGHQGPRLLLSFCLQLPFSRSQIRTTRALAVSLHSRQEAGQRGKEQEKTHEAAYAFFKKLFGKSNQMTSASILWDITACKGVWKM